jgi:chromosome partitioning protein
LPRKLAIANQKGGVGKTTTAINLAACFSYAGRRTLLVDLDPQGNATTGLGLAKDPALGVAAVLEGRTEGVVSPTAFEGLSVLVSSAGLLTGEGVLATDAGRITFMGSLRAVGAPFDEVLLDCPPALGLLTRCTLALADQVLVPIQCEFFAMEGLAQLLAVVDEVRGRDNPGLTLAGVLPTMYDPYLPFHVEVVENLRQHLGDKVLKTVIERDVALAEAASHGVPVVEYDCLSRGAFGYVELGKELESHGRTPTG